MSGDQCSTRVTGRAECPLQAVAGAEGKGSELASDPCRRHGQKLVSITLALDTTQLKNPLNLLKAFPYPE